METLENTVNSYYRPFLVELCALLEKSQPPGDTKEELLRLRTLVGIAQLEDFVELAEKLWKDTIPPFRSDYYRAIYQENIAMLMNSFQREDFHERYAESLLTGSPPKCHTQPQEIANANQILEGHRSFKDASY